MNTALPATGAFASTTADREAVEAGAAIPLHHPALGGSGPSPGKRPLLKSWERFQRAAPAADLLENAEWFGSAAPRNVGVVCGAVSNLVVVDTDSPEAEAWAAAHLPATPWVVRTGKGLHRYYRHPGGEPVRNRAKVRGLAPGGAALELDVRGDGGYVVGPWSVHASGAIYTPDEAHGWPWSATDAVPTFDREWLGFGVGQQSGPVGRDAGQDAGQAGQDATGDSRYESQKSTVLRMLSEKVAHRAISSLTGVPKSTVGRWAGQIRAPRANLANDVGQPSVPHGANGTPQSVTDNTQRSPLADPQLAADTRAFLTAGAPAGERNDRLFRAATDMAGCGYSLDAAQPLLIHAGCSLSGSPHDEVAATIASAFAVRRTPAKRPPPRTATGALRPVLPAVMTPGTHALPNSHPREVSNYDFADTVIRAMPRAAFYRRAGAAGQLQRNNESGRMEFGEADATRWRIVIDRHVRLERHKRDKDGEYSTQYVACTKDLAELASNVAPAHRHLHALAGLTGVPAFVSLDAQPDGTPAVPLAPGYNPASGWYRDNERHAVHLEAGEALALNPNDTGAREHVHEVLSDLVVDFPFVDAADRENVFALLLTLLLRPALRGTVPMFLAEASIERTGKTKLVGELCGTIVSGQPFDVSSMPGDDDELGKAILAWLLAGRETVLIDNVDERGKVRSAVLAGLLTATTYDRRLLGVNRSVTLRNSLTVIVTGNNPTFSGELAQRTIPIRLRSEVPDPELRDDFVHPDLPAYLATARPRVLGVLVGMVRGWLAAGRPQARAVRLGGFEEWASVVGGILRAFGFRHAVTNLAAWRRRSAPDQAELVAFLAAWWETHGLAPVGLPALFALMQSTDYGAERLARASSERAQRSIAGRMLSELLDRPVSLHEAGGAGAGAGGPGGADPFTGAAAGFGDQLPAEPVCVVSLGRVGDGRNGTARAQSFALRVGKRPAI